MNDPLTDLAASIEELETIASLSPSMESLLQPEIARLHRTFRTLSIEQAIIHTAAFEFAASA